MENASRRRSPVVSVLIPTYKQASLISRAIESVRAQTFGDWELVVVDDGSPDETERFVQPYLADPRIRYYRLPLNRGLGAALNDATAHAQGWYLAYLPSDDCYYPQHLATLVDLLEERPDVYLAYSGLRWGQNFTGASLLGDGVVGREAELFADLPLRLHEVALPATRCLALVQVMHRRRLEPAVRWPTRAEIVSDQLEADYWRALLAHGARFAYTGQVSCEWVEHPDQRHKIIAGPQGGLSRYRRYYGVGRGEWLNWQPSRGLRVDERARYGRFAVRRALPAPGGLKILVAGELGFNPERLMAFEERGHQLYGLWIPHPETWDTTGPLPYGNIEDIPYDRQWKSRVRAIGPDLIYGLLNWQALPLLEELLDARLGIPFVFHFKEGPFICLEQGLWPTLMRLLDETDGQIFINQENLEWFQLATGGRVNPEQTFILDGDPPKIDWMGDQWSPKVSAHNGELHTVCTGRPLGLDPFEEIARAGIHVHFYGDFFHQRFPTWTREGLKTGYMHLHPTVEPGDWVRELSQYDAAWFHLFESDNEGDLRRARWDDLNLPARLGTYAAAGLPWILRDNRRSCVAIQTLAQRHDVGLLFSTYEELAAQLRDRPRLERLTTNMRAARHAFAFDSHVDDLIDYFRRIITQHGSTHKRGWGARPNGRAAPKDEIRPEKDIGAGSAR